MRLPPENEMDQDDDTLAETAFGSKKADLSEGTRVHRYLILGLIGKGGMGAVYKAYDPELDRRIAIKILTVSPVEGETASLPQARLMREAQALARLNHPNVVSVFDVGKHEDGVYIAMEYVEGKTLREWISQDNPSQQEIIDVFLAAGQGLQSAHAVGIVHRDFKPDNLLVGNSGQVKVLDFGLARAGEFESLALTKSRSAAQSEAQSGEHLLSQPITQVGTLIGTIAYMAPEHFLFQELDEKTDQFSFCVSLFEALYGRRPFAGVSKEEFEKNVTAGRIALPREDRVPKWIKDIILKGLSLSKEDRFATLSTLLEALSHDPLQERRRRASVRRRIALVSVLVMVAVAVPLWVWYDLKYGSVFECQQNTQSQAVNAWNDKTKSNIAKAFLTSGLSYAQSTWDKVQQALTTYIDEWTQKRSGLCEANATGVQSNEFFGLKLRCFDRRLDEFQKLLGILTRADDKVVAKAIHAATSLSSLSHCLDEDALTSKLEPPHEKIASQVELQRKTLLSVKGLLNTGKYQEGKKLVQKVLSQAENLGYRPLLAETLYWVGSIEDRLGQYADSEKLLQRSFWEAVESDHTELMALAGIRLIWVVGYRLTRADEGLCWGRSAKITLAQLKWPQALAGEWNSEMGSVYFTHGDEQEALQHYQKAMEIEEKTLGKDHPKIAVRLSNIGVVLSWKNNHTQALAAFQRALEINEKVLGVDHPKVANDLINIGLTYQKQHDYERATKTYLRALKIWENALGKEHPKMAWPLSGLGEVSQAAGKLDKALIFFRRVTEICKKSICHPQPVATAYFGLAKLTWSSNRNRQQALALAQSARQAYSKAPKLYQQQLQDIDTWLKSIR